MKLETLVRSKVHNHIRPLFLKSSCDSCDKIEGLELHHVKLFNEILTETLFELEYQRLDVGSYKEVQLNNIINVMLGKHLTIEYLTLCSQCHRNIHKIHWSNLTNNDRHDNYYAVRQVKKKLKRSCYDNEVLLPYLKNIIDERLYKDEKEKLIEIFDLKDMRNRKIKAIAKLNEYLERLNTSIRIKSVRTSTRVGSNVKSIRFWTILKVKE